MLKRESKENKEISIILYMKCCDECLIKTCNINGGTINCLAYMQELKENNLDLKINFNNSKKGEERMKESKSYLNTIEDFTKAFKDNKIVYAMDEFCAGESKLQLINNVPVRKDADGEIFIGWQIKFTENIFYIKEKPKLIIEVGKFYKLAKGSKAFVYHKTSDNIYQVVEVGSDGEFEVLADGSHINNFSDYDIVDYWREDNE